MPSQKQIAANRRNARQSTGPRTEEGKARSSLNALKTGIDAKTQLIRGETYSDLETLTSEYYGRFQPTTPEQRMLVDTLVDSEWLLRRLRAVETQMWENASDIFDVSLGRTFIKQCDPFSRLQRRIDSTHRHYTQALQQLQRLQAEEVVSAPQPQPESDPATTSSQAANPPNGFVPQAQPADDAACPIPSAGPPSEAPFAVS